MFNRKVKDATTTVKVVADRNRRKHTKPITAAVFVVFALPVLIECVLRHNHKSKNNK